MLTVLVSSRGRPTVYTATPFGNFDGVFRPPTLAICALLGCMLRPLLPSPRPPTSALISDLLSRNSDADHSLALKSNSWNEVHNSSPQS